MTFAIKGQIFVPEFWDKRRDRRVPGKPKSNDPETDQPLFLLEHYAGWMCNMLCNVFVPNVYFLESDSFPGESK